MISFRFGGLCATGVGVLIFFMFVEICDLSGLHNTTLISNPRTAMMIVSAAQRKAAKRVQQKRSS